MLAFEKKPLGQILTPETLKPPMIPEIGKEQAHGLPAIPPSGRTRLLAMVRAESRPVYADRQAPATELNTGDADWFFENISCQSACPAHTDVSRYIAHLAEGNPAAAYKINQEDNVFPGILGRICARPCETACRRGRIDEPIAICALKRGASDLLDEEEKARLPQRPARTRSERVAIVGAGPAGLTTAADLVRRGYGVVVYDALPRAGGMLIAGIPSFRLPRDVIKREIDDYFEALGVEFRLGQRIGEGEALSTTDLLAEYAAVYLAAGTQAPRRLSVEGEETPGVVPGLHFMQALNLPEVPFPHAVTHARITGENGELDLKGRAVAVIGAGYTAMDCARSAVKLGAHSVTILYRRGAAQMPADAHEVEEAKREGIVFRYWVSPQRVTSAVGTGKANGLILTSTAKLTTKGNEEVEAPLQFFKADLIITALGQEADTEWLPEDNAEMTLQRDERTGRLKAAREVFSTDIPGLFAAGDFTEGGRNVISAVSDGHKAAVAIDLYLNTLSPQIAEKEIVPEVKIVAKFTRVSHKDKLPLHQEMINERIGAWADVEERRNSQPLGEALMRIETAAPAEWTQTTLKRRRCEGDTYEDRSRETMPLIQIERRTLTTEVELGFSPAAVKEEAGRCLQCQLNIFLEGNICILCNTCVDVCPTNVIKMLPFDKIKGIDGNSDYPGLADARRWGHGAAMVLDEDLCVRCGLCVQFCPTQCITMQHFQPVAATVTQN